MTNPAPLLVVTAIACGLAAVVTQSTVLSLLTVAIALLALFADMAR